jgi:hypothetical protein
VVQRHGAQLHFRRIGSGSPMVGALWGVLVWGEFSQGSRTAKAYIAAALILYAAGVALMAIAYTT